MNNAHKQLLRQNYERAVEDYRKALLTQWEVDTPTRWVADEIGGTLDVDGETFIGLEEIIICVLQGVTREEYDEWLDYTTEAIEFGFDRPNLKSWIAGCPRVDEETFARLRAMRRNLDDTVELERQKMSGDYKQRVMRKIQKDLNI